MKTQGWKHKKIKHKQSIMQKKWNGLLAVIVVFCIALACHSQKKMAATAHQIPAEYESIYTDVQRTTFQYFWEGAEPNSGMGRERFHVDNVYPENDKNIVTTGGSGFGIMGILVGIERGFITRQQGYERLQKIANFLEKADRFHGAWPHWINGETGKVKPFGRKDNGGDLVESSFLLQGLLTVRQYFKDGNENEKTFAAQIDKLWKEVDFNWYRNGKNVLYWHWSPDYAWQMNFPVSGYDECLIMYVLAASSPTHGVPAEVYDEGWARSGKIKAVTT
ncbi:MAG: beta-glucosidase, partial [Segetibacter sp.]|nr:beta-glucosidase [Segetibacter sp.]